MKKLINILLITTLFISFTPIEVNAVTQNQIDASVHLICPDNNDNIFSGSGTIISDKGIILTNKHVVTGEDGSKINYCLVGLGQATNNYADFDNLYVAETKYVSNSESLDAAILYIIDAGRQFSYYNIETANSNALSTSNKIEALGFPGYNDSKLTHTTGYFQGKGVGDLKDYFKASTYINSGNSGGGAYSTNSLMGIF